MAGAAEGPAAQKHGEMLFHDMGLGWHAALPPSHALCRDPRAEGREASPTTAIIDSQSAKAARLRLYRIGS